MLKCKKLGSKFHLLKWKDFVNRKSVRITMIIFLQGIKDFSDRPHGCFFTDQSKVGTRIPLCFLIKDKDEFNIIQGVL